MLLNRNDNSKWLKPLFTYEHFGDNLEKLGLDTGSELDRIHLWKKQNHEWHEGSERSVAKKSNIEKTGIWKKNV